jgi:small multidrug resistance pump
MNPSLWAWLLVAASVVVEVIGTVALKYSDGFSKLIPTAGAATCYAVAIWLMAVAMRHLEMGITYAVWAASGTAATALVGIALFGENAGLIKTLGLVCVIGGVVMLNVGARQ